MRRLALVILFALGLPSAAFANFLQASLFAEPGAEGARDPSAGSLFSGRAEGSLFEKVEREGLKDGGAKRFQFSGRPGVAGLRDLIGKAEAGRANYDAVQHGARIKPPKPPTAMTIGEIYRWIEQTPGQPHAIGRYQFIPPTLRRVVAEVGLSEATRFTPQVQDRLADVLLADAGIKAFLGGEMTRTRFMNNLAKIWAGFPTSSGRSHYHGYAGNYATMTWAQFRSAMDRIFPRG
jgi:hypothetical protein